MLFHCPREGKGGRSLYKLPEPGTPEWGPVLDYVAYVSVFLGSISICRLHKLTLSDQTHITLQMRDSFYELMYEMFSWVAFAGGLEKFFSPGPKPLSAALINC